MKNSSFPNLMAAKGTVGCVALMHAGLLPFICKGPIPELGCLLRERRQATAYFRHCKAITWDSNYAATQLCSMIESLKRDAFLCKAVLWSLGRPWASLWFCSGQCFGRHWEQNTSGRGLKEKFTVRHQGPSRCAVSWLSTVPLFWLIRGTSHVWPWVVFWTATDFIPW